MARVNAKKSAASPATGSKPATGGSDEESGTTTRSAAPRRRSRSKRPARARAAKAGAKASKKAPRAPRVSKGRRPRTRYSDAKRQQILSTARREGLTALEVKKRFGVTPVTYYSWRRKGGAGSVRRKRAVAAGAAVGRTMAGALNIADAIRHEVRTHIHRLLPEVIASELGRTFGKGRRRGRPSR